jgi:hypothetical protein
MAACEDCNKLYSHFGIDTTLSNEQWLMIHPESSEGILCANCIVERASRLSGVIAARMRLDFGE